MHPFRGRNDIRIRFPILQSLPIRNGSCFITNRGSITPNTLAKPKSWKSLTFVQFLNRCFPPLPSFSRSSFDFTHSHDICLSQEAEIPITLVCTWGRERSDFLNPPNQKTKLFADLSNGVDSENRALFDDFFNLMGQRGYHIDSLKGPNKNFNPPPEVSEGSEIFHLGDRIDYVSQYKFVFLSESLILQDW